MGAQKKKQQLVSRSFLKGFGRGLTAPSFWLVTSFRIRRDKRFDGSVEKAWRDVGRALSDATREEVLGTEKGRTSSSKKRNAVAAE
ncbi:MAG: hypothetical protein EOQ86_31610 [Mesorhizobium sp.]|uniref:hypothetical protein n=1 Tax=Mesorhizobium sp. TaxID=1871066 RepID=UPI000FEA4EFF|nr:hypothetical protein [Mesorhizobium sp.]RWH69242.1 MAG: hypothetical protein EOQ85_33395 [Mesorhizobium sp.]RWH75377.1 MAG: hypothetical protein EOQ86_31610 [Mesorhizobium sp.]RWI11080.1 MAG: hypothetical protein EOQ91_32010 [Mesorhizobium sp.]RWM34228.1 MAG: hypothetical protein EOR77_14590 [Mesorhizobium sp.]RWM62789.1 MAG: hypothetical protein EOR80_31275 [Mesorhizobium sp.]